MKKSLFLIVVALGLVCCGNAKNETTQHDINIVESTGNADGTDVAENPSETTAAPVKWVKDKVLDKQQVKAVGDSTLFSVETISDTLLARMKAGGSYPANCTVGVDQLRYVKVLYCNYENQTVCGEIVCNKAIAEDLRSIFLELYRANYQIERIQLIDDYKASDEASMSHNNTSCFCFRKVAGSTKLSNHARGMAIDINTQHNPMVKFNANGGIKSVSPNTAIAKEYAKRTPAKAHMIDRNDLCYKLFIKHGFRWGGNWRTVKDYQHFEK